MNSTPRVILQLRVRNRFEQILSPQKPFGIQTKKSCAKPTKDTP
jgi:hypothetical protein